MNKSSEIRLDILGLFLAGLLNTFFAMLDSGVVFAPGTKAFEPDLLDRAMWISENTLRWQVGWLFWFAVTLSFAWSYFALGRHLEGDRNWVNLAVGLAIIAAAVDLVGIVINLVVIPDLATALTHSTLGEAGSLQLFYQSMENLATALINATAYGLYSVAGLFLLPAMFSTPSYPVWLKWLGACEWILAIIATALLLVAPAIATIPLVITFILFAPWVWGSAYWIYNSV